MAEDKKRTGCVHELNGEQRGNAHAMLPWLTLLKLLWLLENGEGDEQRKKRREMGFQRGVAPWMRTPELGT
ncbi:hypothetical protein DsansV1_C03g0031731 [Dioscorea sansibarensis]